MKQLSVMFIVIVFAFLGNAQELRINTADLLNNEVDYNQVNPLNFGLNPGHSFYYLTNFGKEEVNGEMVAFQRLDEDIVSEIKSTVRPTSLRFPAGMEANFYHFDGYKIYEGTEDEQTVNVGYGHKKEEMNPLSMFFEKYYALFEKFSGEDVLSGLNRNFIHDFVDFVHELESETGDKIEVTYVLNIVPHFFWDYTMDDFESEGGVVSLNQPYNENLFDENVRAIKFLLENDIKVTNIELGNECYYSLPVKVGLQEPKCNVDAFINVVDYYIDNLADYVNVSGFNPSYAIPFAPVNGTVSCLGLNLDGLELYEVPWNSKVKTYIESLTSDANVGLAVHDYKSPSVNEGISEDSEGYLDISANLSNAELIEYARKLRHDLYSYSNQNGSFINELQQSNKLNETTKVPLYFTEWNFTDNVSKDKLRHTFLHGTYVLEMLMSLQFNDLLAANDIRMANLHSLIAGSDSQEHLTAYGYSAPDGSLGNNIETVSKNAAAYIYELIKPLTEQSYKVFDDDIFSFQPNQALESNEASFKLFSADDANSYLIYFANKSDKNINFNLNDYYNFFQSTCGEISYLQAENPSNDLALLSKIQENNGSEIVTQGISNHGLVDIPPYSLGYISLKASSNQGNSYYCPYLIERTDNNNYLDLLIEASNTYELSTCNLAGELDNAEVVTEDYPSGSLANISDVGYGISDIDQGAVSNPNKNMWFRFYHDGVDDFQVNVRQPSAPAAGNILLQLWDIDFQNEENSKIINYSYKNNPLHEPNTSIKGVDLEQGYYYVSVGSSLPRRKFSISISNLTNDFPEGAKSFTQTKKVFEDDLAISTDDGQTTNCTTPNYNQWFKFESAINQSVSLSLSSGNSNTNPLPDGIAYPARRLLANKYLSVWEQNTSIVGGLSEQLELLDCVYAPNYLEAVLNVEVEQGKTYYVSVDSEKAIFKARGYTLTLNDDFESSSKLTEPHSPKDMLSVSNNEVYPNPFQQEFIIQFNNEIQGQCNVALYSINGSKVATIFNGELEEGLQSFSYNNSRLQAGCYILNVVSESQIVKTYKVTKMN